MERPRQHHYSFAHVAFRQIAMARAKETAAILMGQRASEFLKDLWFAVGRQYDVSDRCESRGLVCDRQLMKQGQVFVISLPKPGFMTEAYFIGLVGIDNPQPPLSRIAGAPQFRYFTLEYGLRERDDSKHTVLCEWDGEQHLNYGEGPEPTVADFVNAIEICIS